jgi:hypothetical protein
MATLLRALARLDHRSSYRLPGMTRSKPLPTCAAGPHHKRVPPSLGRNYWCRRPDSTLGLKRLSEVSDTFHHSQDVRLRLELNDPAHGALPTELQELALPMGLEPMTSRLQIEVTESNTKPLICTTGLTSNRQYFPNTGSASSLGSGAPLSVLAAAWIPGTDPAPARPRRLIGYWNRLYGVAVDTLCKTGGNEATQQRMRPTS